MTSVNVQFVAKSRNAKTGPIPTTTSSRETCPDSCPLKDNECYASAGYYTRLNWDAVTRGDRGADWGALLEQVRALPDGQIWRHNVAGDLPHLDGKRIDRSALRSLTHANNGRAGFTYTHHSMSVKHNRDAVKQANAHGFTVNLSADSPRRADELAALEIAPVVAIVAADQMTNTRTPGGRPIVICPAVTRDNVSCATCKLCARRDRGVIVGFPAHGAQKSKIDVN
jgi:hypothetical protein